MKAFRWAVTVALAVAASSDPSDAARLQQSPDDLLAGEVMAVAYSGFREGQHPDRGDGAVNPSAEEILEDLEILVAHDFHLIRMYDSGENTRQTLELIRRHELPIQVLLGIWLDAEVSNHEGCPWLDEPIPAETLAANAVKNAAEVERGIGLAREFDDVVMAVNVGNEALVDWNDHMVPLEQVIAYVRRVKAAIEQPVTVADNYLWWIREGAPLAAEVDFLGVHTYPAWEEKTIDEALAFTLENVEGVHQALPGKPIAVLEAGWATVASEFGERASEANQERYYREVKSWAEDANVTLFFFEAFDEPWKGDPGNPLGAEKHWGLFNVDRTPKQVMRPTATAGTDPWGPLRQLEGRWQGAIDGRLGTGSGVREYEFVLEDQFLFYRHASVRMPQDKSPAGDHHRELAVFSYDRERRAIVLREFMVEGVVPRSLCEVGGSRVVCVSEHVESGPGIRARLTLEFDSPFAFTETYELAFPGDEALKHYFTNRWTRLPVLP